MCLMPVSLEPSAPCGSSEEECEFGVIPLCMFGVLLGLPVLPSRQLCVCLYSAHADCCYLEPPPLHVYCLLLPERRSQQPTWLAAKQSAAARLKTGAAAAAVTLYTKQIY